MSERPSQMALQLKAFAPDWPVELAHLVADAAQAVTELAQSRQSDAKDWLFRVKLHLHLTQPSASLSAYVLQSSQHAEIVQDLLLVSMRIFPLQPDSKTSDKPVYTAFSRHLLVQTLDALSIPIALLYRVERSIAQSLYFSIEDAASTKLSTATTMSEASTSAKASSAMSNKWKLAVTGAGFVAGGLAIGLTGGLAAPAIAPLLVGASGGALGFLAGSSGAVVLGTLFGLSGGGLAAYRVRRRVQGIEVRCP